MLELPGRYNFKVAVILLHTYGFKKNPVIEVDRYLFDRLEIKKDSARRGLDLLQEKGYITYVKDGHKFLVTLLDTFLDGIG